MIVLKQTSISSFMAWFRKLEKSGMGILKIRIFQNESFL